jgi:hypothetical protein
MDKTRPRLRISPGILDCSEAKASSIYLRALATKKTWLVLGTGTLELILSLLTVNKILFHLKNYTVKKIIVKTFLVFIVAVFTQVSSQAQFIVKIRPSAPVVVRSRPPAPSPRHVWVDGEWVWRGNQYVYTEGRWTEPRYAGARWVPGHWKYHRRRGGWFWVPGHWNRR